MSAVWSVALAIDSRNSSSASCICCSISSTRIVCSFAQLVNSCLSTRPLPSWPSRDSTCSSAWACRAYACSCFCLTLIRTPAAQWEKHLLVLLLRRNEITLRAACFCRFDSSAHFLQVSKQVAVQAFVIFPTARRYKSSACLRSAASSFARSTSS